MSVRNYGMIAWVVDSLCGVNIHVNFELAAITIRVEVVTYWGFQIRYQYIYNTAMRT